MSRFEIQEIHKLKANAENQNTIRKVHWPGPMSRPAGQKQELWNQFACQQSERTQ